MDQAINTIPAMGNPEDGSGDFSKQPISSSWIFPQWMAAYAGLKKLLEKDYLREDEDPSTLLSSLSDRLARIW
jgi:hypothetical protein